MSRGKLYLTFYTLEQIYEIMKVLNHIIYLIIKIFFGNTLFWILTNIQTVKTVWHLETRKGDAFVHFFLQCPMVYIFPRGLPWMICSSVWTSIKIKSCNGYFIENKFIFRLVLVCSKSNYYLPFPQSCFICPNSPDNFPNYAFQTL